MGFNSGFKGLRLFMMEADQVPKTLRLEIRKEL